MIDHGASTPWQVKLCLENRFPFLPTGGGEFVFGADYFAHITGNQPTTVTNWMAQSGCRQKRFGKLMMTEADFFSMRQWSNAEAAENQEPG